MPSLASAALPPDPYLLRSHRVAARIERAVIRRAFKRLQALNGLEWAEKHFYLSPEFSPAEPGPYSSRRAPYQREPLLQLTTPGISKIVLRWGSQTGKSLILQIAMGLTIHQKPRPMLMVRPKIEEAENWSKKRLAPMLRDIRVLRERVGEAKSRSSDNTLRQKTFPGGFLSIATSNSPAELAADSIAVLLADEIDRWSESAAAEGDPLELAIMRTETVADALLILASSVGDEDTSRILPEYEEGDQREFHVPCPLCGHAQILVFRPRNPEVNPNGGLRWREGRPETAEYECEKCVRLFPEKHKAGMLEEAGQVSAVKHGVGWIPAAPDHLYPSYAISGLYSPFGKLTWPAIASRFLNVQGRPLRLKVFVTTILNEPWKETGERVKSDTLAQRLERYTAEVPDGVLVLTAAVDVQDHYLEYWVWGWGAGEESWVIEAEQIPGDPNDRGLKSPWRELEKKRGRVFKNRAGKEFRIARGFVDIGGHHTTRVYEWTQPRQVHGWFACQGRAGEIPLVGKTSYQSHAKALLYPVGTFKAKDAFLRSQVFVDKPGPGYVHLADWVSVEQLEGLVSEKRLKRIVRGHVTEVEWVKVREDARNEPLDCRNYSYAGLHSLGVPVLRQLGIIGADELPESSSAPVARRRMRHRGIR
jgi:phage terminase large subunit GpA-like protein